MKMSMERADTVSSLHKFFVGRDDCYCVQLKHGYVKVDAPLTDDVLQQHVRGKLTVGSYQLTMDNHVKWLCFDLDPEKLVDPKQTARKILNVCFEEKEEADGKKRPRVWPSAVLLEASRFPDPSYHVWILFSPPVHAKIARWLGLRCLELAGLSPKEVEVFPKQTELSKDKAYGNFVKLPLGLHQVERKWSRLLDPETFEPLPSETLFDRFGISFSEADSQKIASFEEKKHVQLAFEAKGEKRAWRGSVPCIEGLLAGVTEGYRNEAALRISCFFLNFKAEKPDAAWKRITAWNQKNKPPLSKAELKNVFNSALKGDYVYGCEDVLLKDSCQKINCPISLKLKKRFKKALEEL